MLEVVSSKFRTIVKLLLYDTPPISMNNEHTFEENAAKCLDAFHLADRIVISTHVNPDGDAIGSALGLWNALTERGKTVTVVNHSPTPSNLRFLHGAEHIRVFHPETDFSLVTSADLICILDVNNPARLEDVGHAVLAAQCLKMVIDHHREPKEFADIYAIDTDASSACEMIARLLILGGYKISAATATALYTGIMTDTGNFRFPRTDAELHRLTANLIKSGADPVMIYDRVFNSGSLARTKLLGKALAGVETFYGGKLCVMTVRHSYFEETGAHIEDTEGFVQSTLSIGGVVMGIMFVELSGVIKISVRSKGEVSAVNVAKEFGGGGHFNAAAARLHGTTLEDAQKLVIERAGKEV